jgi:hypothetical protein
MRTRPNLSTPRRHLSMPTDAAAARPTESTLRRMALVRFRACRDNRRMFRGLDLPASLLFPPLLAPASIGELSFAVWLTVNAARWKEIAGLSTASW